MINRKNRLPMRNAAGIELVRKTRDSRSPFGRLLKPVLKLTLAFIASAYPAGTLSLILSDLPQYFTALRRPWKRKKCAK
ncbi:MAG: hypothetical protein JWQ87_3553 [Candidatus Sulfotelmatobacter sp.]|nr:hypothetical protein [Candidatus Sulfotelmatobacter sp.]